MEIKETSIYKYLKEKDSIYIGMLDKLIPECTSVLNQIPAVFSNYTVHNITHSANVAEQIADILSHSFEKYTDLELHCILLVAILHDIGMASKLTGSYLSKIDPEEIRKNHHKFSEEYINSLNSDDFRTDNDGSGNNIKKEIGLLCRSHGESIEWIKSNIREIQTYGRQTVNFQFIAYLLRLGDLLDFDSSRAPEKLYEYLTLPSISENEWKKQRVITNIKKFDDNRNIFFDGTCDSPELYRELCSYFDYISDEIQKIKQELLHSNYEIEINNVKNNIQKIGFDHADLQHYIDYLSVSSLLIGNNLYSDKKSALREILQNSIDACNFYKNIIKDPSYIPEIEIIIRDNIVTIKDNGIGMSEEIIKKHFLSIGCSYYNSESFKEKNYDFTPISHYGIGFLSSFMLTDEITVITNWYKNPSTSSILKLKKNSKYVISKTETIEIPWHGTEIKLSRDLFSKVFESTQSMEDYIKSNIYNLGVKIKIHTDTETKTVNFISHSDVLSSFIDLSSYLNNVDCFLKVYSMISVNKNEKFLKNSYLFDSSISDTILDEEDIKNYCKNTNSIYDVTNILDNENCYTEFEIWPIDDEDFFDQALDVLDDEEEAWDKTCEKNGTPDSYTLISTDNTLNEKLKQFQILDSYDSKTDLEKGFFDILDRNSESSDKIVVSKRLISLFLSNGLYKTLKTNVPLNYRSYLFVKNIRIENNNIVLPYVLGLPPLNIFINVKTKDCYPDVSRSRLLEQDSKKLSYAIGRAFYIYVYENNKNPAEKMFIKDFISKFYPHDSNNAFSKDWIL